MCFEMQSTITTTGRRRSVTSLAVTIGEAAAKRPAVGIDSERKRSFRDQQVPSDTTADERSEEVVEAVGIEPTSGKHVLKASTCVAFD